MNARHLAVVLAGAAWFGLPSSARAAAWVQTSADDFAAGTLSNTTVIGGAVRLAASAEGWTLITGPNTSDLLGLHMISNVAARVVGTLRLDANNSYNVARYDGSAWSDDATPTQGKHLNTVWILSEDEGWAMGDPNGIIYNDWGWQDEVAYSSLTVKSLFLSNSADGWAVGASGSILRFDGGWNSADSPVTDNLNGVSMVSPGEGWIVGVAGRILRYDGTSWTSAASPTGNTLNSVSMLPSGKGWAVGASGTILRCDGASWSQESSPIGDNLSSVWMVSEDEGWAVGDGGKILRYDGMDWSAESSPTSDALRAVSFGSPERGLAVGLSGTALKYERDYFAAGAFVSSVFDRGGGSGDWGTLSWEAEGTSPGVAVKFQVASGAADPPADFRGPDGTAGTYYTTSGQALWSGHDPDRYIRYKAYFSTDNPVLTPRLKSVTITYY